MKIKRKVVYNPARATNGKRIGAFISDLVIFLIITSLFYAFVSASILKAMPFFKAANEKKETSYNTCQEIIKESKIVSFDSEGKEIDATLSFENEISMFSNSTMKENDEYKEMFYYFFLEFSKEKLEKEYDIEYVNKTIFKADQESSMFDIDSATQTVKFKEEHKSNLALYMQGEQNATTKKSYDSYINLMRDGWNYAADLLTNSDYFNDVATEYNSAQTNILFAHSMTALITFTVFYFLYYLLVPFFIKKGQTISKKILHIGVFYENNDPIRMGDLVARTLGNYVLTLWAYPIITVFSIGISFIGLPLIACGGLYVSSIVLSFVTFILSFVCFSVMTSTTNHQSPVDLICKTVVVNENPDFIDETPVVSKEEVIEPNFEEENEEEE